MILPGRKMGKNVLLLASSYGPVQVWLAEPPGDGYDGGDGEER